MKIWKEKLGKLEDQFKISSIYLIGALGREKRKKKIIKEIIQENFLEMDIKF